MTDSTVYPYKDVSINRFGGYDCQIEHPAFGWLPHTVEPDSALETAIKADTTITVTAYPVASAIAEQEQVIRSACAAAITAGVTSSALGAAHTYPLSDTDQANLNASVVASLTPDLASDWTTAVWCEDADGNWALTAHTASQIQTVGVAAKAWVVACQTQKQAMFTTLSACTTAEEVAAVVWSNPS